MRETRQKREWKERVTKWFLTMKWVLDGTVHWCGKEKRNHSVGHSGLLILRAKHLKQGNVYQYEK